MWWFSVGHQHKWQTKEAQILIIYKNLLEFRIKKDQHGFGLENRSNLVSHQIPLFTGKWKLEWFSYFTGLAQFW